MAADYTYDAGLVFDDTTLTPAANATGNFRAAAGGSTQPIFDINGTAIVNLKTNAQGFLPRFRANISQGVIDFGSVVQPVISVEAMNGAAQAAAAAASAAAAQTQANAAATSASASASNAQSAQAAAAAASAQVAAFDARITAVERPSANVYTTSATLALSDGGKDVEMNGATSGTAYTLTVPLDSVVNFPTGTKMRVRSTGLGTTVVAGASGVTVNALLGNRQLAGQYATATLVKRGANSWVLDGDLVAVTGAPPPPPPSGTLTFAKYASPTGSDSNAGTISAPYRTIQKLMDNIGAGEVGAIRAGTYQVASNGATLVDTGTSNHGTSFTNMRRIMGYPGDARPVLRGSVYINSDYTGIENVDIDLATTFSSSNVVPLGIARTTRSVTGAMFKSCIIDGGNTLAQGILLGSESVGLYGNNCRVIACIMRNILGPASSGPGHGIYCSMGTGLQAWGNLFYNIGGYGGSRAVQIYPNATGCYVGYNTVNNCDSGVVWGNAADPRWTDGNHTVENNIFTNAKSGGRAVLSTDGTTSGNVAPNNHWNNWNGNGFGTPAGTTVTGTTTGDPQYTNTAGNDYHISGSSPAAGKGAYASIDPPLSASV